MGQSENIQLTPAQARHIVGELRKMRHDINNHLAVIMATAELLREPLRLSCLQRLRRQAPQHDPMESGTAHLASENLLQEASRL